MNIKAIRADKGGEYLSEDFQRFLKDFGIQPQYTAAYSPQQNGVPKRLNRTLVEAASSMINHADLSEAFWAEAVLSNSYIPEKSYGFISLKTGSRDSIFVVVW